MDIDSIAMTMLNPRLATPEAQHLRRPDHKLSWVMLDVVPDQTNGRPILTFLLYGLAAGIQAVLTMGVWEEDYEQRLPLWHHVVQTFDMAHLVTDLQRGTGVRSQLS
jgi:hypothetical protein